MELTYGFPTRRMNAVVALGMFDGVHVGHQQLLRRAVSLAKGTGLTPCVCTFVQHPMTMVCPERAPRLLTTPAMRAALLCRYGIRHTAMLPFTQQIAEMEPEDFIRLLLLHYQMQIVVVGLNYTFGRAGAGNPEFLKEMGKKYGFSVVVVQQVQVDGEGVSSTRLRKVLADGDIPLLRRLTGRPVVFSGTVVHGKHMGTQLGYPTVNLPLPAGRALPAFGVYLCRLTAGGKCYNGVVNVGKHPTLPEGSATVETHLLDTDDDLYGRQVSVELLSFLRPETKFDSVDELKRQLAADTDAARAFFARPAGGNE